MDLVFRPGGVQRAASLKGSTLRHYPTVQRTESMANGCAQGFKGQPLAGQGFWGSS